ncbi:hypothetical protein K1719_007905 [Acacia pycnantha]|nr:hypothetical protein K1719_007905 [Acacia pycnantha]
MLMRPFRRTLVVKLMGRQPSYVFMVKKLTQIWAKIGNIDILDLDNDFYLVCFQIHEDYMEALTDGGLDLPTPLFDKKFLLNLGNSIGRAIRLDIHTAQRARGKFARMCVKLDLTKPLVPEFIVEGQVLSVVYESLGLLCKKCGKVGNNKERCDTTNKKHEEEGMDVEGQENLGSRFSVLNDHVSEEVERVEVVKEVEGARGEDFPAKGQGRGGSSVPKNFEKRRGLGESNKGATRGSDRSLGKIDLVGKVEKVVRRGNVLWEVHKGAPMRVSNSNQPVYQSYENVPGIKLERYEGRKVNINGKENLHPGEGIEEGRAKEGRILIRLSNPVEDVDPIGSLDTSMEEECVALAHTE